MSPCLTPSKPFPAIHHPGEFFNRAERELWRATFVASISAGMMSGAAETAADGAVQAYRARLKRDLFKRFGWA